MKKKVKLRISIIIKGRETVLIFDQIFTNNFSNRAMYGDQWA